MMSLARFSRANALCLGTFIAAALLGIFLRVYPSAGFTGIGYDEALYRRYVDDLSTHGGTSYPDFAEYYLERQQKLPGAILPPTRFLYIYSSYLWHEVTGEESLVSLHHISCAFSILLMFAAGAFAWRLRDARMGLAVLVLMACAPTQIHMAQHALIDGFFAFWATLCLWFLWENLRRPNSWPWLVAYTSTLALMVITKENAAFAGFGLAGILALNKWVRFGTVTLRLLLLTVVGPLLGFAILVTLCGGLRTFVSVYQLLTAKASVLPYAIATGDGPWYRYLVDLLLISPLILLLAWGSLFQSKQKSPETLYLLSFVSLTYLVMCNIRYGMNLRYTNMWDMPLRYLAVSCVLELSQSFARRRSVVFVGFIVFLCAFDLRQYYVFFVQHNLYELVTGGLLHALKILK